MHNSNDNDIRLQKIVCPYCDNDEYSIAAKGKDFECNVSDQEFTIVRCNNCGLLRLNPRPAAEEVVKIYPKSYNAYCFEEKLNPLMRAIRNKYLQKMVSPIKKMIPDHAHILEGGCGDGNYLLALKQYGHPNWELAGNDISPIAEGKLNESNIHFFEGKFENIDPGSLWDAIILKDVIEHLDSPGKVFKKVNKLLNLNGVVIIETPNPDSWDGHIFSKRYWASWHFPRHWTIYNIPQLSKHLKRYNFKIISTTPNPSPVSWLYSIKYYLQEERKLVWLAKFFDEKYLLPTMFFYLVNLLQIIFTGKTSNMQIVAEKFSN